MRRVLILFLLCVGSLSMAQIEIKIDKWFKDQDHVKIFMKNKTVYEGTFKLVEAEVKKNQI